MCASRDRRAACRDNSQRLIKLGAQICRWSLLTNCFAREPAQPHRQTDALVGRGCWDWQSSPPATAGRHWRLVINTVTVQLTGQSFHQLGHHLEEGSVESSPRQLKHHICFTWYITDRQSTASTTTYSSNISSLIFLSDLSQQPINQSTCVCNRPSCTFDEHFVNFHDFYYELLYICDNLNSHKQ